MVLEEMINSSTVWGYRDSYHEKFVKIYPTFVGKFGYLLFAEKDEFLPYFYNENNDLIFKKVTGDFN